MGAARERAAPWRSWSGLASARPWRVASPADVEAVSAAVRSARRHGVGVKMVGSGHSFNDIAATAGLMLRPDRLRGVTRIDPWAGTVAVRAGTRLRELNHSLDAAGLALHNLPDIDLQTVAGALGTGTHGSGGHASSLSALVTAVTLVAGDGSVVRATETEDPALLRAARVSLGALGILTEVTLRVEPAFTLAVEERPVRWQHLVDGLDDLVGANEHVDAYWFPHTDRCLARLSNRVTAAPTPVARARASLADDVLINGAFGLVTRGLARAPRQLTPPVVRLAARTLTARRYRDRSHRVLVHRRRQVFHEMEYAVPAAAGTAALVAVRRAMERAGWPVAFPVEIRTQAAEDAPLSTAHDRASVHLAFHVVRGMDPRPYFEGVERVLVGYGGRPHWGKLHTRRADDLAPAYPAWADFLACRDRLDPDRVFANPYLDRVLGSR